MLAGLRAVLFLRREDYTLQSQDVLFFPSLSEDVDCEIGRVDNLDPTGVKWRRVRGAC